MTTKKVEATNRVIATASDGVVAGRVMEMRDGGKKALVARDDGKPSEVLPIEQVKRKVGRPTGVGVREPMTPAAAPYKRVIKDVIEQLMKDQNLTWESLAGRSGLSRATIARVLKDNGEGQRLDTIEAIATALGVVPSAFWQADKA